jgi:hypothetical protein
MESESLKDGNAGESAKEQYLKKSKATEDKRLARFGPRLGALANLYFGDSHSTQAWEKGAIGEMPVGKALDRLGTKYGFGVLHDRKIPGSVANIDHILVTDRGVFVIDAKNHKGLVRIDEQGGILSPLVRTLYVGSRNQTKLVEGVKKQVDIVSAALRKGGFDTRVFGILAFFEAEWPLLFKPSEINGILINSKGVEAAVMGKAGFASQDVGALFGYLKEVFLSKR